MRPLIRPKHRRVALVASAAVMVASFAIPTSSWAAETPAGQAAVSDKEPSQAQWKKLDTTVKKYSGLGVFGDDSGGSQVLRLPAGTSVADQDKAAADVPDGTKVAVKTSRFTENEVDRIQKQVQEAKWDKDAGKYSLGSFYDGQTDKLMVTTDAPASVTASLKKTFGDKVEVLRSRMEQQYTRFNDVEYFNGGDSLKSPNGTGKCTSAWKLDMYDPSQRATATWMTTAGHCYTTGSAVENANGNYMGQVKKLGDFDVEAFTGSRYSGNIFSGGTASSTSIMRTAGSMAPYKGLKVCMSGQTTYNHCGHPVSNISYAFNWNDARGVKHYTSSSAGFTFDRGGTNAPDYDNGPAAAGGDSGAPVYVAYTAYDAMAVGSLSGTIQWYGSCNCLQKRMYGVKLSSVLSAWSATLG
ncbi:hypothetical protein [Streptomyces sp. SID13726]|uniref:hypothetical protein n=1 Tax=Streptomyces sp. SID13726 TaxID=2706058 RepID=UPI0013B7035F|nr:hypothetical protein [Streptomyces sp. SID13726]NEA98941.1 hypothetical protein [Streptomyces sp. SID13726]